MGTRNGRRVILPGAGLALLIGTGLALMIARRIVRPIVLLARQTPKIAVGDHASPISGFGYREMVLLVKHFQQIAESVQHLEAALRNALAEKEVLLREIHHRVKNNMQVIIALLRMHARRADDAQLTQIFNECRDRIEAMSLIHEALYQSDDLARIDFKAYLRNLCRNLALAHDAGARGAR